MPPHTRSDRRAFTYWRPGLAATWAAAVVLTGCVSATALDKAVLEYDASTADSISKQLLLNIARVRNNEPMHFTAISSIAATYKFSVSAGVGGALTGEHGSLLVPLLTSGAEENPTVSIAPMQGEEFTQRLLTPFQEQKLTLLLRQGYDVDALLRLMVAELRLTDSVGEVAVYNNRPSDKDGYAMIRRVMAHLSSIQDSHALHVEPLHFQVVWSVPEKDITPESYASTYGQYALTLDEKTHAWRVAKRVNGRVMITNYDPDTLSNEERAHLHEEAEQAPSNDIVLDIRAGHPGGEMPMHGRFRLRSFHEILSFVGRGMHEEPEFDVAPDPRTAIITDNPAHTLDIAEGPRPGSDAGLSVELDGKWYWVRPQDGYPWNRKVFGLLYQLFQMSVASTETAGPAITISK